MKIIHKIFEEPSTRPPHNDSGLSYDRRYLTFSEAACEL